MKKTWMWQITFEKAHLLLMKPAVSLKDNEEKQIQLLRKYVAPAVLKKLPSDFKDRYRRYCGEAYNKVHEFFEEEQFCTGDKKLSENGKNSY